MSMAMRIPMTLGGRNIDILAFGERCHRLATQRWPLMVHALGLLPTSHQAVLDPIFIVDCLAGGRNTGGGYFPPVELNNWLGREDRTGVPDSVLQDPSILRPGCGMIAITANAMAANECEFSLLHEVAHCVDRRLGILPPDATLDDLRGVRYKTPSLHEYAAQAYSRLLLVPHRIGQEGSIPAGESQASCSRRIIDVLRRSPAFRDVPRSWWLQRGIEF